jgi:hypothetical protein
MDGKFSDTVAFTDLVDETPYLKHGEVMAKLLTRARQARIATFAPWKMSMVRMT